MQNAEIQVGSASSSKSPQQKYGSRIAISHDPVYNKAEDVHGNTIPVYHVKVAGGQDGEIVEVPWRLMDNEKANKLDNEREPIERSTP